MAETIGDRVVLEFSERFGPPPHFVVRAPGRVNLIGEHTDYNDGFVLPLAIDRSVWIALAPRADREVHIWSMDFNESASFNLDRLEHGGPKWSEYLKGTARALESGGYTLAGWQGVMSSDVPVGAGLSSSAAVELATARAFAVASGISWNPTAMAKYAQCAENEWVGVSCGIMDQMISAVGKKGHAILIDCRSLATEAVPLPEEAAVAIMDTATRRGLVDSAYNERRSQCEAAAAFFGVPALRDVDPDVFDSRARELDPVVLKRARHVISENARTLAAVEAMKNGSSEMLGKLMIASHHSLKDDFEVSSTALDTMVEIALDQPGCFGARMTGAGFGGCAVALIARDQSPMFADAVRTEYEIRTGLSPLIYVTEASEGASMMPMSK